MLRQRIALSIATTLSLAAFGGCADEALKEKPQPTRVRILATTDEHSHVLATSPEKDEWPLATAAGTGALKGGIARRATVVEGQRADGVPTVLLSNGDFSQGTLTAAAYTVANFDVFLMRKLGYDAIALGNHEFDFGPAMTATAIAAAKAKGGAPPFVLTNALFSDTSAADDTLAAIYGGVGSGKDVVSGLIVDKGGIKVGVVSAMSPSAAYDAQHQATPVTFSGASLAAAYPAYVVDATTRIAAILQPVINQLRAGGARVVVLLFHGGLASTGTNGDLNLLVPLIGGVDLIVGGHTHGINGATNTTALVADKDGKDVPVMQPAPYGNQVAKAEFDLSTGQAAFDDTKDAFLAVDDTVLPTADAEVRAGISTMISSIESSLLGGTLSLVTGSPRADNPAVAGDLFFYPLGHTSYAVTGAVLPRETDALNLDTHAMLAVTQGLGYGVQVALQNAGSIRGDLDVGVTGTIGFSDVYRMVSLGADLFEQSPGFPLVHVLLPMAGLRGAFEQTLQMAYLNNDYYLGSAGIAVEWDPTRTRWDGTPTGLGWVKSLTVGGTRYYDVALNPATGWLDASYPTTMVHAVTPYLVAAFASTMSVPLYAEDLTAITDLTNAAQFDKVVVEWPVTGAPHLKDHQALANFIYAQCAGNGGELPATWNGFAPTVVCTGAGCP
jgi:5'-nucleotidase